MSDDEVAIMGWGRCQIIPCHDRAGRKVFMFFHSEAWDSLPMKTRFRIGLYYIVSMVYGDEDAQRKGAVGVYWMHNYQINIDKFFSKAIVQGRTSKAMPVRIGAIHHLFPDSYEQSQIASLALAKVLKQFMTYFLTHVRIHNGR